MKRKALFDTKSSWRGLTLQLFLLTVLPLTALLLAITFGSLNLHQNAMRVLVGERDARLARTLADALDEQVEYRIRAIRALAHQTELSKPEGHPQSIDAFGFILAEFDMGLGFLGPTGSFLSITAEDAGFWEAHEQAIRGAVAELRSDSTRSEGVYALPGGQAILVLARSPSGWFAGGAFSSRDLGDRVISGAFLGEHAAAAIVDGDGELIYRSGDFQVEQSIESHPGVAEALNGNSGTSYTPAGEGEHVVAYTPIKSLGWALVIEEPWEMVSTPTLRATQVAPLVLVPVLLLVLLALGFAVRQVVQPLQALEAKSSQLAWGDFQAIQQPVGGIEEIRRLQTELVHLAQKVQAAQQGLRGYIGAMTAAQEEERRRLARELHDDTIQSLIALKQRVQLAQMDLSDESSARSLAELSSLTEQTIENLRRLTRALRPIYLEDLGLVTALEVLCREAGESMGLQVSFRKEGAERRLAPSVELALYRIAQEALSNIARHARASQAALQFRFAPDGVVLEISDNGVGFEVPKSPAEFAPGGHFGLLGLYERAELIGAALSIDSAPGQGTRLSVHLPTA